MTEVLTPVEVFPPGDFLRDELAERGWSEAEFADILGRPPQALSEILNGKKEITADTAVAIGTALGTSPELWLNLQAKFRLFEATQRATETTAVARRARLRALVPVRELQKRGWLPETTDVDDLEAAVCEYLSLGSPFDEPAITAAARRSNPDVSFSPEQVAWLARVSRVGDNRSVGHFDKDRLSELAPQVVTQVHYPTDLELLPKLLREVGVALVVELPLKGSKIDGAVMFGEGGHPIIGLSTRGDRLDGFLFTLMHEIAHLVLGHVAPGTAKLDEDVLEPTAAGVEADANELAGRWTVPIELPFTKGGRKPTIGQITAVARSAGVHPSLVIGRLQRDEILEWSDFRRSIPKVRPFLRTD